MNRIECGKRKLKRDANIIQGSLQYLSVSDMVYFLRSRGVTGASKMKRQQLCEAVGALKDTATPTPSKMRGLLEYHSNGCYIDTVLTALFQTNRRWLKKCLLGPFNSGHRPHAAHPVLAQLVVDIQHELRIIYSHMFKSKARNSSIAVMKCSRLRQLFQQFDREYRKIYRGGVSLEWLHTQQEPRDVFNLLLTVFDIPADVSLSINKDPRMAYFNSAYAAAPDIAQLREVRLSKFFPRHKMEAVASTSRGGQRKVVIPTVYKSASVLCFTVERNFLDEKVGTRFKFPEKIKMPDKSCELKLVSVIIHHGATPEAGHYTCLVKNGSKWMHYDDIGPKFDLVGSFKEMVRWKNGYVLRNCTTLVYTKKE